MARLHIGLPMWSHAPWQGRFFSADAGSADYLRQYASVFNSVEGNATFYAIPTEASVTAWAQAVPADFRFVFKLPKLISHDLKLERCDHALQSFVERMQPLRQKMGPLMIQLPPSFDGQALPLLAQFVKKLPAMFRYAVEVRHRDFFDGGPAHQALQDLLARYRMERVSFDSRGLFATQQADAATLEAQRKKPQLPVIAVPVVKTPLIRFVGHADIARNTEFFLPWLDHIADWLEQGREPYVLIHMADNSHAPDLARALYRQLQQRLPALADLPDWPAEREGKNGQIRLF